MFYRLYNPFKQNIPNTSSDILIIQIKIKFRRPQPDNYNSITQETTSSRSAINDQDTM
ncbi:19850_t:CDS:1, partial [Gigaspora margarita]